MGWMRTIGKPVMPMVDVLFPPGCWVDREACEAEGGLSEGARVGIAMLAEQRYCRRCGLTTGPYAVESGALECGRCHERNAGVVRTARVGTFSDPLVGLVHQLKFGRAWEVARVVAPFLYQGMLRVSEGEGVAVDVMVPVPLHWRRKARRGFNQAEELAREVGKLSGWKVGNVLRRVRATAEQARISGPTRRKENLAGAFVCTGGVDFGGKHVWLVDDVSTTGATLHAAATALRKLGKGRKPASINAAVVCVTDHGAPPAVVEMED